MEKYCIETVLKRGKSKFWFFYATKEEANRILERMKLDNEAESLLLYLANH